MTNVLTTIESSNTTLEDSNKTLKEILSNLFRKRKILNYAMHACLGSIVAISTFSVSLAIQPSIKDEPYLPAIEAMVEDATIQDLNNLEVYMDEDTKNVINETIGNCSPSEYLVAYAEEDEAFISILENYFED
jgi:hypothetical protein